VVETPARRHSARSGLRQAGDAVNTSL